MQVGMYYSRDRITKGTPSAVEPVRARGHRCSGFENDSGAVRPERCSCIQMLQEVAPRPFPDPFMMRPRKEEITSSGGIMAPAAATAYRFCVDLYPPRSSKYAGCTNINSDGVPQWVCRSKKTVGWMLISTFKTGFFFFLVSWFHPVKIFTFH